MMENALKWPRTSLLIKSITKSSMWEMQPMFRIYPGSSRVIFTSFGGFIFTCYFFHELETSIVPSTLSYWLYRPGIRTAGETMEKEQIPTSAGRAHSHVPSSSLSQSNLTLKGWPEWWGWDRWAGEGTWDVHRWSAMVSWTHCCCC